jgi:hypothetical protein
MKQVLSILLASSCLLGTTGCFRVGSETSALRDAALDNGLSSAEQKIEVGVGMFTIGAARLAVHYIKDVPDEARTILGSVKGAEVSVYRVHDRTGKMTAILAAADDAMKARHCTRLVGVIHEDQLVAVYVPCEMDSPRNVKTSVLVLNRDNLVCATAHADIRDLLDLAMEKIEEKAPPSLAAAH